MKMKPKNFVFRNMMGLVLLLIGTFLTGNTTLAAVGILEPQKNAMLPKIYQTGDANKIIAILEKQMNGKKLSDKARHKLFTLAGPQTRLIRSLCERISDDERSAGADIACLLVVALILLS